MPSPEDEKKIDDWLVSKGGGNLIGGLLVLVAIAVLVSIVMEIF